MGPVEVLLPYVVKNDLEGNARDLGMVFAAGGVGSVACAIAMGQRDLPAPQHHVHLRVLDARHGRGRRLRRGERRSGS